MSMSHFIQRNSMGVVSASAVRQTFIRERPESACVQRRARRALLCAAIAAAMLMTGRSAPRAHSRTTQVTWSGDVAAIVSARAARCHHTNGRAPRGGRRQQPNGFAPMSFATSREAKTWASAIRTEVLSARMPPWPAAPGYGDFSNDAHLSAVEVELLARWAGGGGPARAWGRGRRAAGNAGGADSRGRAAATRRIDAHRVAVGNCRPDG